MVLLELMSRTVLNRAAYRLNDPSPFNPPLTPQLSLSPSYNLSLEHHNTLFGAITRTLTSQTRKRDLTCLTLSCHESRLYSNRTCDHPFLSYNIDPALLYLDIHSNPRRAPDQPPTTLCTQTRLQFQIVPSFHRSILFLKNTETQP